MKSIIIGMVSCLLCALTGPAQARDLPPYPGDGPLDAEQIAEQVFVSTRGALVDNSMSRTQGKEVAMVVSRAPIERRSMGRKPSVNTFETYANNKPQNPQLESMTMAVITSGKVKGTSILFKSYADESKGSEMSVWLPALRKIRKLNEPAHEDTWVGTNLTYGELVLRRPEHEVHELLGETVFNDCLQVMRLETWEENRYTKMLPASQCGHKGKPVYRLKSTTKFKNWWYDYHISLIDKKTFSIYRTEYFKDGEKIKLIDIDWQSLEQPDPRINYPRYIYAASLIDGSDSMVFVPRSTVSLNTDIADDFWSEETLKKYGR